MSSTIRAFLIWLVPAIVVAVAVARVSVWIQPHFAPLVLFPLSIGAALGALLCGLIQISNLRRLRLIVAGTVLVVLFAAATEHVFFYLDRRNEHLRKALEAGIPEEVLSRPTFPEYMRQQAELDDMKIPLWLGNAVLMVGAAGGMVIWYAKSRHVGESLRDSHSRLERDAASDANGTNAS
jgi:hypothetical protein